MATALGTPWPACGNRCAPPSWDFMSIQLYFSLAIWIMACALGVFLNISSRWRGMEQFKERLHDRVEWIAMSMPFAYMRLLASATQCSLFGLRVQTGEVNSIGLAIEAGCCTVHFFGFFPTFATKFFASIGRGTRFMLSTAAMDCLLIPSVVCMAFFEVDGRKSWCSLSFLGALHLKDAWRIRAKNLRQSNGFSVVLVSWLTTGFFGAMAVLMFETLGDPPEFQCCNKDKWNVVSALYFTVSTVSTVGPGGLAPATSIGRLWTIVSIVVGASILTKRLKQVQAVTKSSVRGLGSYRPRRRSQHVVVTGAPDLQMSLDVIAEIYHEDHEPECDNIDLVFLLPTQNMKQGSTTMINLMEHRKRLPERISNRIYIFQGSVMNEVDMERVCAPQASAFLVFPPPVCESPEIEDSDNVVRAKAIQRAAPGARTILLLHKKAHEASLLEPSAALPNKDAAGEARRQTIVKRNAMRKSSLTAIAFDEFKLGLVAKQAQIPGFVPLISNLCKCIAGDNEADESDWQQEYERGLAKELYELELSKSYAKQNAVFAEVVLDILDRSDGEVYLMGIIELSEQADERVVLLNPKPEYPIKPSERGCVTLGIFMAEDRDAIKQMPEGKTILGRMGSMFGRSIGSIVEKKKLRAQKSLVAGRKDPDESDDEEDGNDGYGKGTPSRFKTFSLRSLTRGTPSEVKDFDAPSPSPSPKAAERSTTRSLATSIGDRKPSRKSSKEGRQSSKERDKRLEKQKSMRRSSTRASFKDVDPDSTELINKGAPANMEKFFHHKLIDEEDEPAQELDENGDKKERDADEAAMKSKLEWAGEVDPLMLTFLTQEQKAAVLDLVGLSRWNVNAMRPKTPPVEVLAKGGHTLYLCAGAEGVSKNNLHLGADHFVRPLRRHMLKDDTKMVPIVIMAPAEPADWHLVNSFPQVYFLQGSPSSQFDLERASIRTASHIFVSQATPPTGGSTWMMDTEVICVVRTLEKLLGPDSEATVVADVHSDKSHQFMSAKSEKKKKMKHILSHLERATKDVDEGVTTGEEYYRSDLFVSGKLFVGTAVTSLAVNTFFNPSLHEMVMTMVSTKISASKVPRNWAGRPYRDLCDRMLWGENMLPVGLWRRSDDLWRPSFISVGPNAFDTELEQTDLVICLGKAPKEQQ